MLIGTTTSSAGGAPGIARLPAEFELQHQLRRTVGADVTRLTQLVPSHTTYEIPEPGPLTDAQVQQLTSKVKQRIALRAKQLPDDGTQTMLASMARRVLMHGKRLDRRYAEVIQADPQNLENLLTHLAAAATQMRRAGMDPAALRAALTFTNGVDRLQLHGEGALGAFGFAFMGVPGPEMAEKIGSLFAKEPSPTEQDYQTRAVLIATLSLALTLANQLSTQAAAGMTRYYRPYCQLDGSSVAPGCEPFLTAHDVTALRAVLSAALGVTIPYTFKNLGFRLPTNLAIGASHLQERVKDALKDAASDGGWSLVLGSVIPMLTQFFKGYDPKRQHPLLRTDAAAQLIEAFERYVQPPMAQRLCNMSLGAGNAAAVMTAGIVQVLVEQLVPLAWLGRLGRNLASPITGEPRRPLALTRLDSWVPKLPLQMLTMEFWSQYLTIAAYCSAVVFLPAVVRDSPATKDMTALNRERLVQCIKAIVPTPFYMLIVVASCMAALGDKAFRKAVDPCVQAMMEQLKSFFLADDTAKEPPHEAADAAGQVSEDGSERHATSV